MRRQTRWRVPALLLLTISLAACATACSLIAPPATSATQPPPAAQTAPPAQTLAPSAPQTPMSTSTIPPLPVNEQGTLNILLLGSDARKGQAGPWRTDVIMWVTIRRSDRQVGILSIPRDLWVNIPTVGQNRINVADYYGVLYDYPGGGPALVADTLQSEFGLETHRYIRLNFEAFEQVIDAMGGITVEVDCPIEDKFIDPSAPGGYRLLDVSAGQQVMDGKTALMFARSRHGRGDIDRTRRQQRVLMGIRDRALDIAMIPRIPRIWTSLQRSVDTDLGLQEILSLALLAKDISGDQIHGKVIDFTMVSNWTTPQGWMVLLPDYAKIREAIATLMDSPPLMEASAYPGTCPE